MNTSIHTLVISTSRGRYALDDAQSGPNLNSGDCIAILLNSTWLPGHVEHGRLYASSDEPQTAQPGYFFVANRGQVCGLCAGMKVRML